MPAAGSLIAAWEGRMSETKRKLATLAVTVAAVVLAIMLAGCKASGLTLGYRTVGIVRDAGDQTGKTMAAVCKSKRLKCETDYKAQPALYRQCLQPCTVALGLWVRKIRPAINTALLATWGALETAYAARKHEAPWLEKIRPAACALLRALGEWAPMAPKLSAIAAPLKAVEGLVCK
jgi:hypothetical protein